MSKKKNKKNNYNSNNNKLNFPFNNEISSAKQHFKQMIDDMPDDVFADFCLFISSFFVSFDDNSLEELWAMDEGWEDEANAFYNHNKNIEDNFYEDNLPL